MRWAIIEVMGHRVYAGWTEDVTVAGAPMLRVHVPAVEHRWTERGYGEQRGQERTVIERYPAFEVDLGGAALFAVTSCPEEVARTAVRRGHRPAGFDMVPEEGPWVLSAPALTGPIEDAEVVDGDAHFDEYDLPYGEE